MYLCFLQLNLMLIFTITTTGLLRICFALAAYRSVFKVSLKLDLAGETQAT